MVDKTEEIVPVLCRVCAVSDCGISIFSQQGAHLELLDKINLCLGISVLASDDLPKHICYSCLGKLSASYELRQICKTAQAKMRQKANQHQKFISNPIIETERHTLPGTKDWENTDNSSGSVDKTTQDNLGIITESVTTLDEPSQKSVSSLPKTQKVGESSLTSTVKMESTSAQSCDTDQKAKRERRTVCAECGLWFPRSELRNHELDIHFINDFYCLKCNKDYVNQSEWSKHAQFCP